MYHLEDIVLAHSLCQQLVEIEGKDIFEITITRAKKGVIFHDNMTAYALFSIVSSSDKRDLHLKMLAAIAQICQEPGIREKWLEASNVESLRHLLILAERKQVNL